MVLSTGLVGSWPVVAFHTVLRSCAVLQVTCLMKVERLMIVWNVNVTA